MIQIKLKFEAVKKMFFDRQKVLKAVDRATARVLSRFGAFVRQSAKTSIKKRKAASQPGQPPSSHTGLLRNFIFFGYDRPKKSVVIGPVRLSNKSGDALPTLEYGGRAKIQDRKKKRNKVIKIKARPFMQPAFEKEKTKLPKIWANSIKK
jgi:hypothetical protein